MNSSVSTVPIVFSIYSLLGVSNTVIALCILVLYVLGVGISLLLVLVICVEPRLQRPMYVLLVNLALSGLVGSSSVCLTIIRYLLLKKAEGSLGECLTQVFFTNMYTGCIFCLLALMAFDRYVSICLPLQYHSIMTPAKVKVAVLLVYMVLSLSSAFQVYLTSRLTLCKHTVDKLLCDSLVISNLSCTKTTLISIYGLCCAICVVICPCVLIILSYIHIFTVVLRSSKEARRKLLQTCMPHLFTFINFSAASFFGVIYNRLNGQVPKAVNIFTCMMFFFIPPLFHPIIYGIKMQEIRQSIKKMIRQSFIHQIVAIKP